MQDEIEIESTYFCPRMKKNRNSTQGKYIAYKQRDKAITTIIILLE
jgi:hypothetical protein